MPVMDHPSSPIKTYKWIKNYPPEISWQADYTAAPLYELFDTSQRNYPKRTCINFFGRKQTYEEVGSLIDRTAAALQSLGITKGSRVGLFLPNCPAFIIYYYATLKVGATIVNYNPLYTVEELSFQIKDSATEIMITLDLKFLFDKVEKLLECKVLPKALISSFSAQLPILKSLLFKVLKQNEIAFVHKSLHQDKIISEKLILQQPNAFHSIHLVPETDVAVLQYTGGTTGTPKGAMLTHANLYINTQQVKDWTIPLGDERERVIGVLPFFHIFAMTVVMNLSIAKASEIIIVPRFKIKDLLKLIHKLRPTIMPGVPTLFNAILNYPKLAKYDLRSLKFCLSGGAPLPVELMLKFQNITKCCMVEGYGLSEASPVVTCNLVNGNSRSGSIGLPLPRTVVSLRSLLNPNEEVAIGERGELCVKGPQVMQGYWKRTSETVNQFTEDGFLRTGDVAIMDEEGFFQIVDRIKDLIISSGYNIYPRQIEEAIYRHPSVEEVTVIGIEDSYRGEAPKAFIKLKSGMNTTTQEILYYLETKLSKIEIPKEIEFRETLPKTMIGKLSKKELRAEEAANRRIKNSTQS